jgi:anti-sigma factor RsiW
MKTWWRRRPLLCPEVGRTLQAYLDGRVDDEWAARVEAHLEGCRRCGMEAKTYRELKEALAHRQVALREDTLHNLRSFAARLASGENPSSE